MKLIIQLPCYNEGDHLPETIAALPRSVGGVDCIEYLVIDDGSRDNTSEVARQLGVHHIVRHRTNRGLAAAFRSGLERALREGADIIVNTDADNQYDGRDIAALAAPIIRGEADIVVGDRGVRDNAHFGPVKRQLQRLGSATVQRLSNTRIPDAVSGFRALSREAAQRINITSDFSYTTEMLIQAGRKRMAVVSVPIRTNGAVRPSRLFRSIPHFIVNTSATMLRAWAMYNPLRAFVSVGLIAFLIGLAPMMRFLWFYFSGDGGGHIQSLIIGAVLIILGVIAMMLGALADLIGRNRNLIEQTLERVRQLEEAKPINVADAGTSEVGEDIVHGNIRRRSR
jgi:glycosyltransferase involved in cell wall biosynthesis